MDRGKLLILFIFGVSIFAALFAWWYQYNQGRRSLAFWGAEGAMMIRTAPQVTLLKLAPADAAETGSAITIDGVEYLVVEQADLSQAHGLVHARQALISDVGFDWDNRSPDDESPEPDSTWDYLVRFEEAGKTAEIALNLQTRQATMPGRQGSVVLGERLAGGLATFFAEHLTGEPATAEEEAAAAAGDK